MKRTVGMVRSLYSTVLSFSVFLSAAALLFSFALDAGEGGETSLAAIWTSAVSPLLPILAAFIGMDVWSEERRTGRIEALLSAPVREREYTLGKFLGIWATVLAAIILFLVSSVAALAILAPSALTGSTLVKFIPGLFALALQSALWCAVALAASAAFKHSAAAALTAIAATVAVPRGIWFALMAWSGQDKFSYGEMPLDAHAFDMANGLFSTGVILSYAILTVFALFLASKFTAALRLGGRGAKSLRWSTATAIAIAAALALSLVSLAGRLDLSFVLPFGGKDDQTFTHRTQSILAETRGEIDITAFLSRKDVRFRPLSHFLRALAKESEMLGGARIVVSYVDPHWDVGAAERLVRAGASEDTLVFERGRRRAIVNLSDGFDERACSSAILRVALPPQRRAVCWTHGHGEISFEAYGAWGMSDIARDIARDGYRNERIDLASQEPIPDDCALIIVAGPKNDFSRAEAGKLDAYLRKGGRLLLLLHSLDAPGIASIMSGWGIRASQTIFSGERTLSGSDVIVSEFSSHPVSAPLENSQIVLEKPFVFSPSAAVGQGGGADRIDFAPLASVAGACIAAVTERGIRAGDDLAIRPTRIIAVGDAAFAMNGRLAENANANKDFFLNCVAFLAGTDAMGAASAGKDKLVSGMDRHARLEFVVATSIALPGVFFLVALSCVAFKRRRA